MMYGGSELEKQLYRKEWRVFSPANIHVYIHWYFNDYEWNLNIAINFS
jgi:hypothetical protein